MPAEARSIPDEILYHFVTQHQSVDELFNTLYVRAPQRTDQTTFQRGQRSPGATRASRPDGNYHTPGRPAMHAVRGRLEGSRPPRRPAIGGPVRRRGKGYGGILWFARQCCQLQWRGLWHRHQLFQTA
ncbi:MAG: hypothetical protein GXP19_07770 [Gammaproteobacteria bacterium]|nr:hypothetical protein [Gammaproteobacteria bacterium]